MTTNTKINYIVTNGDKRYTARDLQDAQEFLHWVKEKEWYILEQTVITITDEKVWNKNK